MSVDWDEYLRVHSSRANLLLHLFAVPLFIASAISAIKFLLRGDWNSAVIVSGLALVAMALQGAGHKNETEPPRPFSGPLNFLRRWLTEQFLIFPLFFITGRWWTQYRAAGEPDES